MKEGDKVTQSGLQKEGWKLVYMCSYYEVYEKDDQLMNVKEGIITKIFWRG